MIRTVVVIYGRVDKKTLAKFFSVNRKWRSERRVVRIINEDTEKYETYISCRSKAAAKVVAKYFERKRRKVKCISSG